MAEVVAVMRAPLGVSNDGRHGRPPSPCTSGTLLIVLALRRHIPQPDGNQGSDVYTYLHSCGAAQNIDRPVVFADDDVLEAQLVLLSSCPDITSVTLG